CSWSIRRHACFHCRETIAACHPAPSLPKIRACTQSARILAHSKTLPRNSGAGRACVLECGGLPPLSERQHTQA
ncbi:MAG: hypothetical protein AVDCRST_MAG42-1147, partial [uncultured Chthoniobacterales bacterium]